MDFREVINALVTILGAIVVLALIVVVLTGIIALIVAVISWPGRFIAARRRQRQERQRGFPVTVFLPRVTSITHPHRRMATLSRRRDELELREFAKGSIK